MSATEEDLRLMFREAERRGDRQTAIAAMDKLESLKGEPTEQVTPKQKEPSFGDKLQLKLDKRLAEVNQTLEDHATGKIGTGQANIQVLGKGVAGSVLDIIGAETTEAVKGIGMMIPDSVSEPIKQYATKAWDWVSTSEFGQYVGEELKANVNAYKTIKEKFPQEAKTLESVVNIGLLMAPAKTKAKAEPSILGKGANVIEKSGRASAATKRTDFVTDLISPVKTKKVLTEEAGRTVEQGRGIFKHNVVTPSPHEKVVASQVERIKGVTPKNTVQRNYNIIAKENQRLAQKLEADVGKRRIFVLNSTATKNIDDAVEELVKTNPTIIGNAQTVANRVATKAKELISANEGTPLGILNARKQLDQWIKKQKGAKIFAPDMENTLSVSLRTVRQAMNKTVEQHAHGVGVKNSLKRQNLLYDAMENIAPKAAAEANHAIARAWQNAVKVLPFRGVANQELALLFGMGGLGAAAVFAPWVSGALAVTLTGMGIKGAIISPKTRLGLAKLLKMVDRAILTSENPSMIKQLRADRALLVDLMKNAEVIDEQQEQVANGN